MKLACNWSKELQCLLENNEIKVDYVKASAMGGFDSLLGKMRKTHKVLLHGLGLGEYAGMAEQDAAGLDFKKINCLLEFCGSPHLGIHLSVMKTDVKPGMTDYDICDKLLSVIDIFKKNVKLPLLVENTPDCSRDRNFYGHHPFTDAKLISHIVNTADIGFLMDITHAKISCIYNDMDVYEYAASLPLERIREVHVNGSGYDEAGEIIDNHAAMADEDFLLLQWILKRASPEIITLEYGWQAESVYSAKQDLLKENLLRLMRIAESI